MRPDDAFVERVMSELGAEPITIAEVRERLVAAGVDIGEPDEHGFDQIDRALQMDPGVMVLDDDLRNRGDGEGRSPDAVAVDVAAVLDGVALIVDVDADWAEFDRLGDVESIAPLVWPAISASLRNDPFTIVGAEGEPLGPVEVSEHPAGRGTTDTFVGPSGWLAPYAGGRVTLTLRNEREVHVAPFDDAVPEPTDAQCASARAAFERVAARIAISSLGDDSEVRIAHADRLTIAMVLADRAAFTDGPVAPALRIAEQAGLSVDDDTVGTPETDWEEYRSWQSRRRMEWMHGLDDEQAKRTQMIVGCALDVGERGQDGFGATDDERVGAIALMAMILDDPAVAERAWAEWTERGAVPDGIREFVETLADVFDDDVLDGRRIDGVAWLRAQHALASGHGAEAEHELREAVEAGSGHRGVLVALAGIEADRSDARAARRLLDRVAAIDDVDITGYDDRRGRRGEHAEGTAARIAREIEPMLRRPPPSVGRNERCPCGSGRKYKQCHLGRELWPIEVRVGWLFAKAMRFLDEVATDRMWALGEELAGPLAPSHEVEDIVESFVPMDLLLAEGGGFARFLEQRGGFLPDDERGLADAWVGVRRAVFTVNVSNVERLELLPVDGGPAVLVEQTLTREPLPVGIHVITRPLPMPDGSYRIDGGILPMHMDLVDEVVDGLASGDLDDAVGVLRAVLA